MYSDISPFHEVTKTPLIWGSSSSVLLWCLHPSGFLWSTSLQATWQLIPLPTYFLAKMFLQLCPCIGNDFMYDTVTFLEIMNNKMSHDRHYVDIVNDTKGSQYCQQQLSWQARRLTCWILSRNWQSLVSVDLSTAISLNNVSAVVEFLEFFNKHLCNSKCALVGVELVPHFQATYLPCITSNHRYNGCVWCANMNLRMGHCKQILIDS